MNTKVSAIIQAREAELWAMLRLFDIVDLEKAMPRAASALSKQRLRRPGVPRNDAQRGLLDVMGNASPDIVDFFEFTNGLDLWPESEEGQLFRLEDVGKFSTVFKKSYKTWSTPDDDEREYGGEYSYCYAELADCFSISSNLDGSYFLINGSRPNGSSYECWWLSYRHPGVKKFLCFTDLLDQILVLMINRVRFGLGNSGLL